MLKPGIRWAGYVGIVLTVVGMGVLMVRSTSFDASDFSAYYFGSLFWRHGTFDKEIYETVTFNQRIMQEGMTGFVSYTPFPPLTAVFYVPFTFTDLPVAKFMFNLVTLIVFTSSLLRLLKAYAVTWLWLPLIALAFVVPVRNNVLFGQAYLIVCTLILEGMLAYESRHHARSALLWGMAIVWKVFPAVLLLFVLWEKDWRHLARILVSCLVWIGVGILATGVDVWIHYATRVFPRILNGEFNDTFAVSYQTFFVWLRIMFVKDALGNPSPVLNSPALYIAGLILYKIVVLAIVTSIATKPKQSVLFKVGLWMAAALLLSSGGTTYSLVLLLPLGVALIADLPVGKWSTYGALAALGLAVNIPTAWVSNWPVWLQFPRLLLLLAVVGALTIRYGTTWSGRTVLAYGGIVTAVVALCQSPERDPSVNLPGLDRYGLVYDYAVRKDTLLLHYWTEKGPSVESIGWPEAIVAVEELDIHDNQVWCGGKQVTNSGDNKKKPILVNGREVLYLSDRGRGVGFYTLRKVDL